MKNNALIICVLCKTGKKILLIKKMSVPLQRFLQHDLILGTLKIYQIDLKSLSPAITYTFDYKLGDEFFESIDGPEVRHGIINVSLSVVRLSSVFELEFRIEGKVTVICDRCLDDMEIPIETINRLIVTFGEAYVETSDEQIIVSEDEGFIDVAWYIYEFTALSIPVKHIHESGGCNEIMTSKLKELCVDEVNEEEEDVSDATEGQRPIDPRWNALRNLIESN